MHPTPRPVRALACVAAAAMVLAPTPILAQNAYRAVTVQAAPGELLALIDLYREERAFLASIGEEPPLWMRHTQGDAWDLLLLYPVGSLERYFADAAMVRRAEAPTPRGRSGAELQRQIRSRTAWREEVFVHGPPVEEVKAAWAAAGFFHVEMFQGLAGQRDALVKEREMENDYLVALGRRPNHIFTRVAGSATDAFTVGYYEDLRAYANPPAVTPAQEDRAARDAGFEGADRIGSYLRTLILRHHDTLGVPIPDA